MSTLSSANVTDDNLVLKERTHMRLCINMLIFTHNLGNWLIVRVLDSQLRGRSRVGLLVVLLSHNVSEQVVHTYELLASCSVI